MTNYQLQLNNHKTEMISIATKTVLNTDSVPMNLEGSDIKLANTVRILGVCLDPTLSSTANLLRCRISAIRHNLSEDVPPKKTVACVCSFKTIIATHFWRAVLSIFFLNSQRYRKMLQDSFSKPPDPPRSLLCFIPFTGYLLR